MQNIEKYFPDLTDIQKSRFSQLEQLYRDWNAKINVISRKDIDNLYLHHVLHSLAIAKECQFVPGTRIVDVGCGGGFPGIPLAIMFPQCSFTLADSIGKKIRVAQDVALQTGLDNVICRQERIEDEKEKFHFAVSRAALKMPDLYRLSQRIIYRKEQFNSHPNGIFTLKGGDLTAELQPFRRSAQVQSVDRYFREEYFEDKKLIYIPVN